MPPIPVMTDAFKQLTLGDVDSLSKAELDGLPFGVVGLSREGFVEVYSETESRLAGLPASTVLGSAFFLTVAQCMNNFLVAQRFADEEELDEILPYVLTFRMRPTPVTLRLLQSSASSRSYLFIQR